MFIHSADLSKEQENSIKEGRNNSFPEAPSDHYFFKQLPYGVLIAEEEGNIIGQCSIIYRIIKINTTPYKIFGVCDLWVGNEHRRKGVASQLLNELEKMSLEKDIDLNILIADEPSFYKNNGFKLVSTNAQWLRIHQFSNYGVSSEEIHDLMIKEIKGSINDKIVNLDFLGEMF